MDHYATLLTVGGFGRAVGRWLTQLRPATRLVDEPKPENFDTLVGDDRTPILLASWRPATELCVIANQRAFSQKRVFIPLVADHPELHLGPVVDPAGGGCWDCWAKRQWQHSNVSEVRAAALRHYERETTAGPRGFLEAFAAIGAAQMDMMLQRHRRGEAVGGSLWQIDMLSRSTSLSKLVPVNGCPNCGLNLAPDQRNYARMQQQLEWVWVEGAC